MTAVFEVVHALPGVALAQLLTNQTDHHGTDPLFTDDGILGGLESLGVVEVHAVESGRDFRLHGLEALGLGGRHRGGLV